jgi:VWFA-related protein
VPRAVRYAIACLVVCLAAVVPHLTSTRAQQAPPSPQFRAGVDLLQLDVSALDKSRKPVRGLAQSDFTVEIDGKPAPIVAFTPITLPPVATPAAAWMKDVAPDAVSNQLPEEGRLIVVMFDRSLNFDQTQSARRIARTMVAEMAPGDLAATVYVGQAVPQNFTADRSRLLGAIDQPFLGADQIEDKPSRYIDAQARGECLCGVCRLEAIEHIADALRTVERRRKLLLFIGSRMTLQLPPPADPWDPDCSRLLKDARGRLFRALDQANVVVHSIDPSGLKTGGVPASIGTRSPPDTGAESERQLNLGVLPARTGGRVVANTNAPEQKVADVLSESGSYYVLGVERPGPKSNGRDQEVEIKVNRKGVTVSSSRSYNPATARQPPAATPEPNEPPRALVEALAGVRPATAIDLTMTASVFDVPGQARSTVAIVTTIAQPSSDIVKDRTEAPTQRLNILAGAWDRNGRPIATQARTVEVSLVPGGIDAGKHVFQIASRLDLPAGKHDIRVAVEDPRTGKKGSVYTTVEVPNFDNEDLSLSDTVLGAAPAAAMMPSDAFRDLLPIVPTAVREFTAASRVTAFVRVYQSGRDTPREVTMTARLVGASDVPVFNEVAVLTANRFMSGRSPDCSVALPISTLTPGPYLLTLTAAREGKRVVRHTRFDVK